MNVFMVPSVAGGIGHISRTATLARALKRLDPNVHIEFVFDAERLRPFNIDAVMKMGYRPRLLPKRLPDSRGPLVRACFNDADVVVDDVSRYLVPLRHHVPQAAWISIAMHPIGDELFMDWPLMAQMDAIIWAYPPAVGLPEELELVADKVLQTGPFLDLGEVPEKAAARRQLGLGRDEKVILYAPRGFPFGQEFGARVLGSLYSAVSRLRQAGHELHLVLLAVGDPSELRGVEEMPDHLPDWVSVRGVVTPPEALLYEKGADVLIAEGTSTIHEGAALGTPMIILPGPIEEIRRVAKAMQRAKAAPVLTEKETSAETMLEALDGILTKPEERDAMIDRARALVSGGGGVMAAARLVLEVGARHRAARAGNLEVAA
jgi:glycosyltransferase involved in cell wall biosynthesis